jgi:hypothetical protein
MAQSAPLVPLTLIGPGFAGLNTQTASTILGPEWASEAMNLVFDESGRLATRKGWTSITTSAMSGTPDVSQLHEYVNLAGTSIIVSSGGNKIWSGTTAPTDVTGAVVTVADNWQFTNFNNYVLGKQTGETLIVWNGTGNFADVTPSAGTLPTGNHILGAFGRLWGTNSDNQTLKYSVLLDHTDWASAGSGSFNFASVWTNGTDQITAIAAFDSFLVVFGKRHIILLEDGTGSELGFNPLNAVVSKVITGIGCIARDSIQNIDGNDLFFLSNSGVQSLVRAIEADGNPLRDVSKNVRDALMSDVGLTTAAKVRSTFNPRLGMYILLLPEARRLYCFSTKLSLEDNTCRVTRWNSFIPNSLLSLSDGITMYSGKAGEIYSYSNYLDDSSTYRIIYNSGWLTVSDEVKDRVKMLKKLASIMFVDGQTNIIYKWGFDFKNLVHSLTRSTLADASGGEWGEAEWGDDEFGGATGLNEFEVPTIGSGQFIKVGIESDINNTNLAIQNLQLFAKIGRVT